MQEDLSQRYEQTKNIENQLHQIAEMNRTMATELSSQMEMAEQMYTDALFATTNLERGNVQLGKAARVKKESGCNSFIVLVGAAFLLLFVDYVYPGRRQFCGAIRCISLNIIEYGLLRMSAGNVRL